MSLAAFNCEVAQVRNVVSQPLTGEIRLQWWRDLLDGSAGGRQADDGGPVAAELLRTVAVYDLPRTLLIRLIDAHVFDVYDDPMPDMAALEAHCRDTASALYALRARVLGSTSPDIEPAADHAGLTEGLTQVMLDLPRQLARRQIYVPGDLLKAHNVPLAQVFAREVTPGLADVLAHLRGEARRQYDAALALVATLPSLSRPAFLRLALVERTLAELEKSPPFDPPSLSRLRTLWTLWRAIRKAPFKN
jgi:phytoene synthase